MNGTAFGGAEASARGGAWGGAQGGRAEIALGEVEALWWRREQRVQGG